MLNFQQKTETYIDYDSKALCRTVMDSGYQLEDVSLEYLISEKSYPVFRNLNLNLSLNDLTVLVGPSGCGKTTLLRLLAQLLPPTSGRIRFFKDGKPAAPKVGMVFQESRLFPWLKVADNITIHMKKGPERDLVQKQYLELMGLEEFASAYPAQLSGGMAQRIAIARALAYEPDILLMDEPFNALDYFARLQMQDEILRIYRTLGIGIVFVTHNVDEALHLATDLLVLRKTTVPVRLSIAALVGSENEIEKRAVLKQSVLDLLRGELS